MNTDWLFQDPVDFEHKQYLLFAFLQKVEKDLDNLKLYPNFQLISLHLANINLILEKGHYLTLNRVVKDPDDEILISDLVANELPKLTKEQLGELLKICEFSLNKFKDFFEHIKALWEVVNDSISINVVSNVKNIDKKQGLICVNNNGKNYYYEFAIKNIRKNTTETKCVVKKICECDKSELSQKIKECKRPLIKNLQNESVYKNLITFNVNHTNQFPMKETLMPIVKRKIANYIVQTKVIEEKNLTKRLE